MISIIIPTFNEENQIRSLIDYLYSCRGADKVEIIVSDGGSSDNTEDEVNSTNAKWTECPQKGRAAQMNHGAKLAGNQTLYFLHADTIPPKTFIDDIVLSSSKVSAGCFQLSFDSSHPLLKFYSWFTQFDINIFRFGDQSLFVNKELFEEIDGFNEKLIVMEDQDIVVRLKKQADFVILKKSVTTSSRKYKEVGTVKLQLIFTAILIMYYLGIDQSKLVHFYKLWIR